MSETATGWLWEYSFCGSRFVTNETPHMNRSNPQWGWMGCDPTTGDASQYFNKLRLSPFPNPGLQHPYCISRKGQPVPSIEEQVENDRALMKGGA